MAAIQVGQSDAAYALGSSGGGGNVSDPTLKSTIDECVNVLHHNFYSEGTNPPFTNGDGGINSQLLMDRMAKGEHVDAVLDGKDFRYELRSLDMLKEFCYTESGRTENLPPETQQQLALLAALKKEKGAKYYTAQANRLSSSAIAAPIWLMRGDFFSSGSKKQLFVGIPGESMKRPIRNFEELKQLASQLGVAVPGQPAARPQPLPAASQPAPTMPPQIFTPPAPATAQPSVSASAPPPATPQPPAAAPAATTPAAPPAAPPPAVAPAGSQAPAITVSSPGDLCDVPANKHAAPPPLAESPALNSVFAGSLVVPSSVRDPSTDKKAAAPQQHNNSGVPNLRREERVFVMPADASHLNEFPHLRTGAMDPKLQKEIIDRFAALGQAVIYVNVTAPNDSQLGNIRKKYPVVGKFLDQSTVEQPLDALVAAAKKQSTDGTSQRSEVLFTVSDETKKVGRPDYYKPPTVELASSLAAAGLGTIYISMKGGNRAMVNALEKFLCPSHTEDKAVTRKGELPSVEAGK